MKLEELLKEVKKQFIIDDTLKVYLYKDKIEFIEYIPEINEKEVKLKEFYGKLLNLYLNENNQIVTIEPQCISLFTPRNKNLIIWLTSLINETIEDYNNYDHSIINDEKEMEEKCINI